jgi:ribonuclease BN (tRNA processing enzyme)
VLSPRLNPTTQVVLLGTGTPNADPERSGPCVAVIVNDVPYLVDFGPGVVRRAAAAYQKGIEALAVDKLATAFLTHLHSDHTAGYPDLIFTPWVLEREQPLRVYGPSGLRSMTEHILAAYQQDVRERIQGLESANPTGYEVIPTEIEPGVAFEEADLRIEAFQANHGSWSAFSYRFVTPGGTIVISGDTAPYDGMAENYAGCDILVHEVYSWAGFQELPRAWKRYHAHVHTSTKELAAIAAQARPGLLVLYHQLPWGESEESLIQEIKASYSGSVVSGRDLDVFEPG